jgi:hypothetical protein
MLLKTSSNGYPVLRLFAGWVDYAARKAEQVARVKTVYVKGEKTTKVYVEKTTAALAALLKTETPAAPMFVVCNALGKKIPLAEYVKLRAEKKAAKTAQAAALTAAIIDEKKAEQALMAAFLTASKKVGVA